MPNQKNKSIGKRITTGINVFYLFFEILTSSISLCLTLYLLINTYNFSTHVILTVLTLYILIIFIRSIILLILYFLEINISKIDPWELSPTLTRRKTQFIKTKFMLTKLVDFTYAMYDYGVYIIWFALLALFDYLCLKQWNTNSFIILIISLFLWISGILLFFKRISRK